VDGPSRSRGIPKKKHNLRKEEGLNFHLSKHNTSDYQVRK